MPISRRDVRGSRVRSPDRSLSRQWIVEPFLRGFIGLPLILATVVLALSGRADRATKLLVTPMTWFPVTKAGPAVPRGSISTTRLLAFSAMALIPAMLAFAAVSMQLFVTWSGYLYPLRPDTIAAIGHPFTPDPQVLSHAWGGPTLMGAWAVHSCVALALQSVCGLLLVGLSALQNRSVRWLSPTHPRE